MLSILLGFTASLSWGAGDFFGGVYSRRAGAYRVSFYAELFGIFILLIVSAFIPHTAIPVLEWLSCFIAGAIGSVGLLLLYIAMANGKLILAAPIASMTGAVFPVLTGMVAEGFPGIIVLAGFFLALLAIWLITRESSSNRDTQYRLKDLNLPIIAGLCFGTYYILIHHFSSQAILSPLIGARLGGSLILFVIAIFKRQANFSKSFPWPLVFLTAALDLGGNTFYILAGQAGRLDVSVVLSSLYPGVTAILAWLFLKETISRSQFAGILAALGAIFLITI